MSQQKCDWPPPYKIRVSARSKRMTLKISARHGLEIVIPRRTSQQKAIEFLNLKYEWVQKHSHLLVRVDEPPTLPDSIYLPTINEEWRIIYKDQASATRLISSDATHTLLIKGTDFTSTASLLKKWLRIKGKQHLMTLLTHYSQMYQLPYQSANVRYQHSRWGSCSRDKVINLNCKLLLLSFELSHYVIVHELIHTLHFDHSPAFWDAVAAIVPNHKELRAQLKKIELQLPNWLY